MVAPNRAARELADLTQATQSSVDQAQRIAAQDREAGTAMGRPRDPDKDGKASLALPEGIATAVAAGFILGPIGGAVMGIAQAWLGKKERQNILDQWAADNDTWESVEGVLDKRINDLEGNATNANDLEQLHALRAQQDAALKLVRSGNPNMQQRGVDMLSNIDTEINDYTERQETQRIEQEAIDAQLQREMDREQYTRYTKLQDDFQSESLQYEETQSAINIAKEALERGTPADLHASLILINKALDPTSIVREAEARAVANLGNWFDKATTSIQAALGTGQQASPDQRKNLLSVLNTIEANNTQLQLARETRYTTELDIAGLDNPKYLEPFRRVDSVPAYQEQGLKNTENLSEGVSENADSAVEAAGDWLVDAYRNDVNTVSRAFSAAGEGLDKTAEAISEQADKVGNWWMNLFRNTRNRVQPRESNRNRGTIRRTN